MTGWRDEAYRALRESQQQLMEANIELQRLNNVDGLTGASNRKQYRDRVDARRANKAHCRC
jgi:two-component system chemotaxis family response regulator WspR